MTRPLPHVWALNGTPEIYIYFRNAGQTPASELTLRGNLRIMEKPPNDRDFNTLPLIEINDVLEPSAEIKAQRLIRYEGRPNSGDIASTKDGETMRFYVWGKVSYLDVFDTAHHTFFCYSFYGHILFGENVHPSNRGLRAGNRSFCPHPKNN